MRCARCEAPAVTWIRYSGQHLCSDHFLEFVERRVKRELKAQLTLRPGDRLAIGMSGGKDSSVAATLLHGFLSRRGDAELVGITVDEGIEGYRPHAIGLARDLCSRLGIEHRVRRYADHVGVGMDEVVRRDPEAIPCSYCGVFRRQLLNLAAKEVDADYVVTGLNLDDTVQSILMNLARGDVARLARLGPHDRVQPGFVPRLAPLRTVPEKEVYLYARLRGIPFSDAACPHADRAQRGLFRETLNRLEQATPGTRHALLSAYESLRPLLQEAYPPASLGLCPSCGEPTAGERCKACELRERLSTL